MDIFEIEYAKMRQKELDRDIQAKTQLEWQGKRICIIGTVKPWPMKAKCLSTWVDGLNMMAGGPKKVFHKRQFIEKIQKDANMRIRSGEVAFLGCGFNKRKYAGAAKICNENGLDFNIYRLGAKRIKRLLQKSYNIDINIEGRNLIDITREAQEIVYQ